VIGNLITIKTTVQNALVFVVATGPFLSKIKLLFILAHTEPKTGHPVPFPQNG
jgi:hypothetical protein